MILGPDHLITEHPVVGVITDEDIDKVAQIRARQYVRLHWARPGLGCLGRGCNTSW